MAATSCQIYFPPFFSSVWGFPSVHWLPNVCLCHWDRMAITIITTSWVRQAVQPPPFIATEGFTTLYWGFVYTSLSFIILPYICLRYCHSNAPALWLRPLVRVKRKQEGVGRKILHSVYPAIIQLTDNVCKVLWTFYLRYFRPPQSLCHCDLLKGMTVQESQESKALRFLKSTPGRALTGVEWLLGFSPWVAELLSC